MKAVFLKSAVLSKSANSEAFFPIKMNIIEERCTQGIKYKYMRKVYMVWKVRSQRQDHQLEEMLAFEPLRCFSRICHRLLTVIITSFFHPSSLIDNSNSLKLEKDYDNDKNVTIQK